MPIDILHSFRVLLIGKYRYYPHTHIIYLYRIYLSPVSGGYKQNWESVGNQFVANLLLLLTNCNLLTIGESRISEKNYNGAEIL